jgi:hypothetical protein
MENVLVENSRFYSTCNALKFGTDSQGDFRNVLVRNVEVGGPALNQRAIKRRRATSGVAWEVVDGGTLENVLATGVNIVRSDSPLFLRLGNRGRTLPEMPKPKVGILRHVVFEKITGDDNGSRGSLFTGIPSARIEDVIVRNMNLSMAGGGKQLPAGTTIPEKQSVYPDAKAFGKEIPAYGFWVRHASGVEFIDVRITPLKPDPRPCFLSGGDTENLTVDGKPL